MSESVLQREIILMLRRDGFRAWKVAFENRRGCPDLIAAKVIGSVPVVFWMEVKYGGGRVSAVQKRRHKEMQDAGMEVYVVRSLAQVQEIVQGYYTQYA